MKSVSLSIKITLIFIFVSCATMFIFYTVFTSLFEKYTLQAEKEKVHLIAGTLEPIISMNYYLGLTEEASSLAQRVVEHKNVLGGALFIDEKVLWENEYDEKKDHFHVDYPIKGTLSGEKIGKLRIAYSMDQYNSAVDKMRFTLLNYLGLLSVFFLVFALFVRYLLNPLSVIAHRVKAYRLGDKLDFEDIRMEPETEVISEAFLMMVDNVREHTVLLEQYKLSVDESSIVSKMDPHGSITYVNDEYVRVCGYDRDELLGAQCDLLSHPEVDKAIFKEIWKTIQEKNIWKGIQKNITKAGNDYYVKSTIVPLLGESSELLELISIQHDITQVYEQSKQILRQTTDQNTGLPNRIKLSEDVVLQADLIFGLFSLDNYDVIKNYYGYEAAYDAIKQLSENFKRVLGPQGVRVYKLAGGEFGFLAKENADLDWFKQVCRFAIEDTSNFQLDVEGDSVDLRASIGYTSNKANYLSYSGLALRHALDSGKSLVYYEDQGNLIAQHENNLLWTRKVKSALADERITLFVQPLIDSKTMQITKYECLVRLIDEDGKYVSPFFFLDVAKKTKLYHLITSQVISISFEVFSKIKDKDFSINISAEDILHNETVEFLEQKIVEYNIGNRLILEIVESEGIDGFDEITAFISKMKAFGCRIAIDDFGTGYSNFSYLMQLKVDYIKIDGSLIKEIDHDRNSQIICSTILSFSAELEMQTVAEFVHNEAVLECVKEMGFDYLQGFHLGEPMPIHDLLKQ